MYTLMLAETDPLTPEILAFAGILFLLALWAVARAQRKFETKSGALAEPATGSKMSDPALADSMRGLLLQLEETHRKINGTIDTRFKMLAQLVAEADKRIAEMKALRADPPPSAPTVKIAPSEDPETAEIYRLAGEGLDAVEIARRTQRQRGEIDLILSLRKLKQ